MEKPEKGLMAERPRAKGEGLLSRRKLLELTAIGGYMGAAAAGLYLAAPAVGIAANVAQTMAFNFMTTSQMVNSLNARKEGNGSPFEGIRSNKLLIGTILGTIAAQVALPFIPGIGAALRVVPLSLAQWLVVAGLSAAVLPIGQLAKRIFGHHPSAQKSPEPQISSGPAKPDPQDHKEGRIKRWFHKLIGREGSA